MTTLAYRVDPITKTITIFHPPVIFMHPKTTDRRIITIVSSDITVYCRRIQGSGGKTYIFMYILGHTLMSFSLFVGTSFYTLERQFGVVFWSFKLVLFFTIFHYLCPDISYIMGIILMKIRFLVFVRDNLWEKSAFVGRKQHNHSFQEGR